MKKHIVLLSSFFIFALFVIHFILLITNNIHLKNLLQRSDELHSEEEETESLETIHRRVFEITNCYDQPLNTLIQQRGDFWVLYNFVQAEKKHNCSESVTYTTQGDYTFLDNLIPLIERWRGPVSVALHAPGTDFQPTLNSIAYLRNCKTSLIRKYVTFHVFFNSDHLPQTPDDVPLPKRYIDEYDCFKGDPPYEKINYKSLYKTKVNISYPINVARNIARETAQTHFVLASDIELYPSFNLIEDFLRMVVRRRDLFEIGDPLVFALPVFEVLPNATPPTNKLILKDMVTTKRAFSFHKNICNHCHAIPNLKQWLNMRDDQKLDVFTMAKRQGTLFRWEAFYIGTKEDPFFDERMDWERHGNKMVQAYLLCLLDYDYMVLNNAFLVHKPGVKKQMVNAEVIPDTAKYISKNLSREFDTLFGKRKGCRA